MSPYRRGCASTSKPLHPLVASKKRVLLKSTPLYAPDLHLQAVTVISKGNYSCTWTSQLLLPVFSFI
jgi:hypothetical protein